MADLPKGSSTKEMFEKMDTNKNGIVDGKEKKAYWESLKQKK